ncbi:MAG TPA: hypothetical protein VLU46_10390 [Thermoanaerobaculia bacterium]|nr:hypothetical protein [Thermoanaerobaculia bacterium]
MNGKVSSIVTAAVVLVAAASPLSACPVCFGDPNSPMVHGTSNAILFLLGVVGFVQLGFVAMFVSWWRNAEKLRKHREEFRLIEGGVR